jgi:quercetin dioxygenase-like cupin family protein
VATTLLLSTETQFAPNGIVSRTLLNSPEARVVLFGFAAGQELSKHTSSYAALVQVLSGECEFPAAGRMNRMKAGDILYMPAGCVHAVRATQPLSMLLTLFKSHPGS